jgi:hypothetical protein
MSDFSNTWGDKWDRATYLLAEAQYLVGAALVALGLLLWRFGFPVISPPEWVGNLLIGWLVLAPPSVLAGFKFYDWLRARRYTTVFETNAVTDDREKWLVPPDLWQEKNVNGAAPHRVNDGDAFEVREFDWAEQYGEHGQITVKGVWLSELRDAKLVTAKAHFATIYDELIDDHLELTYRRDSEDELAARLQRRLVNRVVEARENGEMLAPDDVRDVVKSFKEEMRKRTDREELSDIRPEDVADRSRPGLPEGLPTDPTADVNADHTQPAATDGGSE